VVRLQPFGQAFLPELIKPQGQIIGGEDVVLREQVCTEQYMQRPSLCGEKPTVPRKLIGTLASNISNFLRPSEFPSLLYDSCPIDTPKHSETPLDEK